MMDKKETRTYIDRENKKKKEKICFGFNESRIEKNKGKKYKNNPCSAAVSPNLPARLRVHRDLPEDLAQQAPRVQPAQQDQQERQE